jgi:hypothetical protein
VTQNFGGVEHFIRGVRKILGGGGVKQVESESTHLGRVIFRIRDKSQKIAIRVLPRNNTVKDTHNVPTRSSITDLKVPKVTTQFGRSKISYCIVR